MIKVLGIDPSYTRTGLATHNHTRSLNPSPASANLPPLAREARRRAEQRIQLRAALTPDPWDVIAIEGMYPTTEYGAIGRAALLGTITDLALTTPAAVLHIAPATPKILATGDGGHRTDKTAMHAAAQAAGSPAQNGDEADAWWIARLVHYLLGDLDPGQLPHHRARALTPYRPPFATPRTKNDKLPPDPWVRRPTGTLSARLETP